MSDLPQGPNAVWENRQRMCRCVWSTEGPDPVFTRAAVSPHESISYLFYSCRRCGAVYRYDPYHDAWIEIPFRRTPEVPVL